MAFTYSGVTLINETPKLPCFGEILRSLVWSNPGTNVRYLRKDKSPDDVIF